MQRARVPREDAETSQSDFAALFQRAADDLNHPYNVAIRIRFGATGFVGQCGNEFFSVHVLPLVSCCTMQRSKFDIRFLMRVAV